jgi:TolB-like protein/Tfp pilus assembly protein PilF
MQTLLFLVEHRDQVITRGQFFDSVWQGRVVNEEALSRAISLLRTALDDNAHAPEFIQTIPGVGYRLIAQIKRNGLATVNDPSARLAHDNSIAVLPFVNLSKDPDNEYFSDGISEEILNSLANVKQFKVAGRTSSFHFKGQTGDIAEIAQRLGVASVLEGSVRQAGARVRITAQLINAADGYHLWSKTFDREMDDIFAIQDEIATAVADALQIQLLGETEKQWGVGGTKNPEAYNAYLLGMHYINRGHHKDALRNAADSFQRAVDIDPLYAKAYVGLANSWVSMTANSYAGYEDGNAERAISRALELAPDLADAWVVQAFKLLALEMDISGALAATSTALGLSPGSAEVQIEYARIKCYVGHNDESIAAARKALGLDPVSLFCNHFLAHVLYFTRDYDEAISAFRRVLEMDPHYPKPHYFIAMALYHQGDTESAWQEIQHEPLNWMNWTGSALVLQRLGRMEEANAFLDKLSLDDDEDPAYIQQADVYAQRGDIDQAMERLGLAFNHHDPGLSQLLVDPFLDPLREDPRFVELMKKLGFLSGQ